MAEGETHPAAVEAAAAPAAGFGRGFLYGLWYFAELGSVLRPGALKRYEILGEPVLLGRARSGEVYALRDICPHRAAPLSAGRLVKDAAGAEMVECPYHGWTFRTHDGVCAKVPSMVEGQDFDPERIRVRSYPVRESQGLVWIFMAESGRAPGPAPDDHPPVFDGVVGGGPRLVERMDFDAHLDHAVVGLMDPAHGPYVHQQWWWRSSASQHEKSKAFEPRELGFAMVRHAPSSNSYAYKVLGGRPATVFRLPALRWEHIAVGKRQVLALTCLTPVTDKKTRITQLIWSDHWAFALLGPFIRMGARRFLAQDGAMVNLQNQGLAYDPPLLWVDDADRQAKWYQQLKKAWSAARASGKAFVNPVQAAVLRWRS